MPLDAEHDLPFVRLVWHDHSSLTGWVPIRDDLPDDIPRPSLVTCWAGGYVVRCDAATVTITVSANENGEASDPLTIARTCILRMRRLSGPAVLNGVKVCMPKRRAAASVKPKQRARQARRK